MTMKMMKMMRKMKRSRNKNSIVVNESICYFCLLAMIHITALLHPHGYVVLCAFTSLQ